MKNQLKSQNNRQTAFPWQIQPVGTFARKPIVSRICGFVAREAQKTHLKADGFLGFEGILKSDDQFRFFEPINDSLCLSHRYSISFYSQILQSFRTFFKHCAVARQEFADREKKENFVKAETEIPVKNSILFSLANVKKVLGGQMLPIFGRASYVSLFSPI